MGDVDEVIGEPDEWEGGDEVVEGAHPHTLENDNPMFIKNVIGTVVTFLASNGWYIVGVVVLGLVAWNKFEPKVREWLKKREEEQEASFHHRNPDILLDKLRRMDEARARMQEQYNIKAAISLEQKLEKEKKMKEEEIAEWERMKSSEGYRLNDEKKSNVSASASTSAKGKQTIKAKLRPEYNPMTGDTGASSSCRWRPTSRGPSGGGGG